MITLKETVNVNGLRGHVLGGESNHRDTFYISRSGKTQKDTVTLTVYSEAYNTVCDPKIDYYQPIRASGLVLDDLPFIVYDTMFTVEMFDSYPLQKVTLRDKGKHMADVNSFDAYVFQTNKTTVITSDPRLCLYEVVSPDWAMLPMGSDGSLKNIKMFALTYNDKLTDSELDRLGCVVAKAIWQESGVDVSDMVGYPETLVYRSGVPVKSDYEHLFVTPTSTETQSLVNLTVGYLFFMYIGRVRTVVDSKMRQYVSVRYIDYLVGRSGYVSLTHINDVMDLPRSERLLHMDVQQSGSYTYKGADYDEFYIRYPDTPYAKTFGMEFGIPSFPSMYANIYDSLPDDLKNLESAETVENVCAYYYTKGVL